MSKTKFKIDSIFGVVPKGNFDWEKEDLPEFQKEYDEERATVKFTVFVSDKKTWDEKHYCYDHYTDDTMDALRSIGLEESMEAVFEQSKKNTMNRIELIVALAQLGFVHNQEFEDYMKGAFE